MSRDPRIDAKIAQAPTFAQPILTHLRALVHATIPGIEETIKWNMPHFVYKSKNVTGIAAFKAHCAIAIHGDAGPGDQSPQYIKIASLPDPSFDGKLADKLLATQARIDAIGSAVKRGPKVSALRPDS